MARSAEVKHEARRIVDSLADDATWDDLAYLIFVRQKVERGLADSKAGRVVPHEQILAEFGIVE